MFGVFETYLNLECLVLNLAQNLAQFCAQSSKCQLNCAPDFGGSVLHGQFTTPGGDREAAAEGEGEEEYRPDYTDQVSLLWSGLSEILPCHVQGMVKR